MLRLLKCIAIVVLLVASAGAAIEASIASNVASVANTISNNEHLNATFEAAALVVDDFQSKNHRLPPNTQFHGTIYPFDIEGDIAAFPEEALADFGPPPPSSQEPYVLIDWGYDVPKVWASWTRTSTAFTDPARFYVFGSSKADMLLFGAGALVFLLSGIGLWWGLTIRSSGPLRRVAA